MSIPFRRLTAMIMSSAVLSCVAGCGSDPVGDAERARALAVSSTQDLGSFLVDGQGNTLYVFEPDEASEVSCTFTCATNWPPLTAAEGAAPAADEGVDPTLIGTRSSPSGGEVVTYRDWPLYRYAADKQPGQHRGQDINLNGGLWYVMRPDGSPLIP
ncbi:COG4315 family predicted lipoprotein [Rhodococcoides corynebacterioides]|uniref:COG4315 family predicted lipoprotein n=1 Tax=Rhodococcoides corynebacterioides TaxID=53972 RepID=UPI001C9B21B8|nr:hypothetical protein [Rhodococcus corynebacterioides]MBY6348900.1 hypothetical protein [Rhodococcus corynebacterioides]